jgi:hypothetical protein
MDPARVETIGGTGMLCGIADGHYREWNDVGRQTEERSHVRDPLVTGICARPHSPGSDCVGRDEQVLGRGRTVLHSEARTSLEAEIAADDNCQLSIAGHARIRLGGRDSLQHFPVANDDEVPRRVRIASIGPPGDSGLEPQTEAVESTTWRSTPGSALRAPRADSPSPKESRRRLHAPGCLSL